MKANRAAQLSKFAAVSALIVLAASCSGRMIPAPMPSPSPTATSSYLPLPPPRITNWRDAPITPGTWHWRMEGNRSVARFGLPDSAAALVMSCNRDAGSVTLIRPGAATGTVPMTIQTSTVNRTLSAAAEPGLPPVIALTLPARDGLLDAMAFSRGRFVIETAGLPTLYVPSWTEVSRVIEDCR